MFCFDELVFVGKKGKTMQAIASPTKRRAVLGALDANAAMSTEPAKKAVVAREDAPALLLLTPSAFLASSDRSTPAVEGESAGGKKRGVDEDGGDVVGESPAAKKACVDGVSYTVFLLDGVSGALWVGLYDWSLGLRGWFLLAIVYRADEVV